MARYRLDNIHYALNCQQCHQKNLYKPLPLSCSGCHREANEFYRGILMSELLPPEPDLMSKAVRCEDCHKDEGKKGARDQIKEGCQGCHNQHYVRWFEEWERILTRKEAKVKRLLSTDTPRIKMLEEIYQVVKREKYHNFVYANDLLDYCLNQLASEE